MATSLVTREASQQKAELLKGLLTVGQVPINVCAFWIYVKWLQRAIVSIFIWLFPFF